MQVVLEAYTYFVFLDGIGGKWDIACPDRI
jgi:hypothetical protein